MSLIFLKLARPRTKKEAAGQIDYTSAAPVGWGEFYFARRSPTDEAPPRYVCCGHKPRRDRRQCATHSADLTAPLIKNQSGFWPNQPPFPIVVIDIRRVPNPVPWAVPWLCAYWPCACARAPRLGAYCSHTPGGAIWAFPLFCGERGKKRVLLVFKRVSPAPTF